MLKSKTMLKHRPGLMSYLTLSNEIDCMVFDNNDSSEYQGIKHKK
jgi:hypothetical protein